LTTLGDQFLLAQLGGALGQFGPHLQHLALGLRLGQRASPGRPGPALLSTSALYWALTTAV